MTTQNVRYGSAWEKFHLAVLGLAVSEDSLQQRIRNAYILHLSLIEHDDVPEGIREEFHSLHETLNRIPAVAGEGSAAASASALDELEAPRVIASIVSMYDRMTKYGPNR
jgi:hypothetical protein